MGNLNGKYAVVTGAAKGLGRAIAERFLADGVEKIALLDFDQELLNQTAEELGNKVEAYVCDVSNAQSVKNSFDEVKKSFGRIDILVNNAGITRDAMFAKMTDEQWHKVISVDLDSVYYCSKQVVSMMKEQKYGKIINMSSIAAFGNIGQSNYGAAKAGIIGLTKTMSKELAKYGITVNALCPSMINTDILKTIPEEVMAKNVVQVPARRVGEPSEVASVVSFFASDDSSYVTGEILRVAGGAVL